MVDGWGSLLGELIPLAVVVAASPLSIIPALLLVLHSARPRPTGLAYLAGWLLGLTVMTGVFVAVPR
ncbi:MAG: GAP family protein, partial [Mycobacterium sp.]